MNKYPFFDTSALLRMASSLPFPLAISSITLEELEHLKSTLPQARLVLKQLASNRNYTTIIFKETYLTPIVEASLPINNDNRIIACALTYDRTHPDEVQFITADVAQSVIANLFFGEDSITLLKEEEEDSYTGYIEIQNPPEEELAYFYENRQENTYNLLTNQYLLLRDTQGTELDLLKWNGEQLVDVPYRNFSSDWFGVIKPKDVYQKMFFDSLSTNQMSLVSSPAGSGKTLISFAYLFSQLEHHKIDKIIIFCNTCAVRDAARLGFYVGSRTEKLLDSQIGNLLASKLGGMAGVERLIQEDKLVILPMSDVRGFDTTGMRAGVYISEAQNLTISLIKLAIQRVGEDSILIIDGDFDTQVDEKVYEGDNNGMRRVLQVFKGQPFFGAVKLKNIYRSKLAAIAEQL